MSAGLEGICFFCKRPRRRRRLVALPGAMARSLFPAWDAEVLFPARVCTPCLKERPEYAGEDGLAGAPEDSEGLAYLSA